MAIPFSLLGYGLLGYFSGSMSFALWITRMVIGVDVRDAGSGHASTTNTLRQAGLGWGIVVLALDLAKGYLPTMLALKFAPHDAAVPAAAAMAVVGHCWPLFAQFRGGMGLATAGGGLLAVSPFGFVLGVGIVAALTLLLKHSARAGLLAGIIIAPVYYLIGERGSIVWVAAASGIVIAIRFTSDWNRVYRELWLDREFDS